MSRSRRMGFLVGVAALSLAGCGPGAEPSTPDAAVVDLALGEACVAGTQCASGVCADGVCCSAACDGACVACVGTATGVADGTCAPVTDGLDPDDDCAADACAPGTCDGAGACRVSDTSVVCRAAAGGCDVAESCDGVATACPSDGFAPSTTECRPSAGPCDVAERCSGSGPDCGADVVASVGTPCRAAANVCDVADGCDGLGAACVDQFVTGSPPLCGDYRCDASAPLCLSTCSSDSDCAPGRSCLDGQCAIGRRIFTTNAVYPANLGGLFGADQICAQVAASAGLTGSFRAWLSDGTVSASARLEHFAGPYYRVLAGQKEVVAYGFADLTNGDVLRTLGTTEYGLVRDSSLSVRAWTGTTSTGASAALHCAGWTSTLGNASGIVGNTGATNSIWTEEGTTGARCDSVHHLYCVEQPPPG